MSIVRFLTVVTVALAAHALALAAGGSSPAQQQPAAPPAATGLDYEMFKSQIQPMFIKKREGLVRCVQCHGRGQGTGGLLIIPPAEGTTSWTEEQSRKNFDAASRVVAPGSPESSRLLMHPLARDAGGDPFHGGGKHWASKQDPEWQALARWANTGRPATSSASADFEVYRAKIEPIFLVPRDGPTGRASCAGCHSGIATRLRLQAPPESGSWTVEQSRQNFAAASQLIVAGEPAKSRLLLHPLDQSAGGDPSHTGGKFWKSQDDPEWQALASWVRAATPAAGGGAAAARPLDFDFFKARVQPMFVAKRAGLVRCVQCHGRGGGTGGLRIMPPPEGSTAWTDEQARQNFDSASRLVVPGDPTASRLLMHPLARAAGGDPFHGGGKHWTSQDDPEWQTLAAWVRGATTSSR